MMNVDFVPGAYMIKTRYGKPRAVASFVWLELAPATVILWPLIGWGALWFPVAHWALLGLYELGYYYNDRAATAGERARRPVCEVGDLTGFITARVVFLVLVALVTGAASGVNIACWYAVVSTGIVGLLCLHTLIGERVARGHPARWIIFAWLAALKYLPAVLATAGGESVYLVVLWVFLLYGGGRVLDYALIKGQRSVPDTSVETNAAWFVAVAPPALAFAVGHSHAAALLSGFLVIAAHHAIVFITRVMRVASPTGQR